MCTRALWPHGNGAVLVGRTMDYYVDTATALWKLPRGATRGDAANGELDWTSRYGSLIAAAFDLMTLDGVNEAGLGGHLLMLSESDYGERDASRPGLGLAVWLQYYLDNFATVADAVAWTRDADPQIVVPFDPSGGPSPVLHLALEDASGDSAIVEYLGGSAQIHHGPEHTVLSNSPTYDKQLAMAAHVYGLGGDDPIPGSTRASDRFARAAYYLECLPEVHSQVDAMAAMLSLVHNVAQPFRAAHPDHPEVAETSWLTVADLTNGRYLFSSTRRPNMVWCDLGDLDFSPGSGDAKLDLADDLVVTGGIAGEVSGDFRPVGPMTFLSPEVAVELGMPAPRN